MDLERRRRDLVMLYERSPIRSTLGVSLHYEQSGSAVFELPYNPGLDNAMGNTHGGILATLLDKAGWFTVAQHYETWIATVDLHVQLLLPADKQHLHAVGKVVRAGRRLGVATMEVRQADGTLLAIGSGTYAVTAREFGGEG